ncbi:MAG: hypothetical protein O7A03_11465, partial [Alphaproteobacteria bacterium]|nr:hypothetical protein [Alphaproteobacteria bacterium]
MMRPATLMLLMLVAGAVGAVFFVSHEVSVLDDRLAELNAKIKTDYRALHVLHAEWSYLNEPRRLEALAWRHLDLVPLAGRQLSRRSSPAAAPFLITATPDTGLTFVSADRPDHGPGQAPEKAPGLSPGPTAPSAAPSAVPSGPPPPATVQVAGIGDLDDRRPLDAVAD